MGAPRSTAERVADNIESPATCQGEHFSASAPCRLLQRAVPGDTQVQATLKCPSKALCKPARPLTLCHPAMLRGRRYAQSAVSGGCTWHPGCSRALLYLRAPHAAQPHAGQQWQSAQGSWLHDMLSFTCCILSLSAETDSNVPPDYTRTTQQTKHFSTTPDAPTAAPTCSTHSSTTPDARSAG